MHYLFWDNDGILVDTEQLYFQASAETLATIGIELSCRQFIDISLQQGRSIFELTRGHCSPETIDQLRTQRDQRYAELLGRGVLPMAGVLKTLQQLKGRVKMAIVTSSKRNHFELIHRHTDLLGYFEFVLTREDYRHTKPHPEPYLTALQRSRCDPGQCLVIEDSFRGLQAAVAAGLPCVVVPGKLNQHSDFSAATRILRDISELPDYLCNS